MMGIQSGKMDFMPRGTERTQEATITREGGCFGPGKTIIDAGKGSDDIHIHTNDDGSVNVNINGEDHHFSAQEAKNLEIRGGSGNDNITSSGEAKGFSFNSDRGLFSGTGLFFGGAFSQNTNPNLTIDGGKGNDYIEGGSGNDTILGGAGRDSILGGCGDDKIDGGDGNDVIMGECGNDVIHGGRGNDSLSGGVGNDDVYGDAGRDFAHGGEGNDWVQGGSKERGFIDNLMGSASPKDAVNERNNLFDRFFSALRG